MTKSKESKEKLEDLEMMTALNKRPSNPTSVVTMDAPPPVEFADCITNQHTAQRRRHHQSQHSVVCSVCLNNIAALNRRSSNPTSVVTMDAPPVVLRHQPTHGAASAAASPVPTLGGFFCLFK